MISQYNKIVQIWTTYWKAKYYKPEVTGHFSFEEATKRANESTKLSGIYFTAIRLPEYNAWIVSPRHDPTIKKYYKEK